MLTSEEIAEVDALEADSKRLYGQLPSVMNRVQWLCQLVKRLDAPESVPDDRDKVLQEQAARISELEGRLKLTPERVLALERAELKARDDKGKQEKPIVKEEPIVGAPTIVTDDTIVASEMLQPRRVPNRLPVQK